MLLQFKPNPTHKSLKFPPFSMARKTLSTFFNQETSNHNQSQTFDQSLSNQIASPLRFNPENSPLNSQSPDSGWSFSRHHH